MQPSRHNYNHSVAIGNVTLLPFTLLQQGNNFENMSDECVSFRG